MMLTNFCSTTRIARSSWFGSTWWAVLGLLILASHADAQCVSGICDTSLTFGTQQVAGVPGVLRIGFTLQFPIRQFEEIELYLPGFSRPKDGVILGIPPSAGWQFSWQESKRTLTAQYLNSQPEIAANISQTISAAATTSPSVPLLGLQTNQQDLTIRRLQNNGDGMEAVARPFDRVQPVGVLLNTTLAFSPSYVVFPLTINIGFTHSANLSGGTDTVSVFLEAFTKDGIMETRNSEGDSSA